MSGCDSVCHHGDLVSRDGWGRPVVNGVPLTRASTVAKVLDDTRALTAWKQRTLAVAVGQNPDLVDRLAVADPDDRVAIDRVVDDAMSRVGSNAAAARGTALHDVISRVNDGLTLPAGLPPAMVASVDAYRSRVFDGLKLTPVMAEQFVVTDDVAGTFDALYEDVDGVRYIGDLKTGARSWERSFPGPVAIQCAVYQAGERWCPREGYLDTPETSDEGALLVSLPVDAGVCHVDVLDLKAGRRGLELALEVLAWRRLRPLAAVGTP